MKHQQQTLSSQFSGVSKKTLLVATLAAASLLEGCAGLNNGLGRQGGYPSTNGGYGSTSGYATQNDAFCTSPRLMYPQNAEYVAAAREMASECTNDMRRAAQTVQDNHRQCDQQSGFADGMQDMAGAVLRGGMNNPLGAILNGVSRGNNHSPSQTNCHQQVESEYTRYLNQYQQAYLNRVDSLTRRFSTSSYPTQGGGYSDPNQYRGGQSQSGYPGHDQAKRSRSSSSSSDPVSVCQERQRRNGGMLPAGDACWSYLGR